MSTEPLPPGESWASHFPQPINNGAQTEAAQANLSGLECSTYTWQARRAHYDLSLAESHECENHGYYLDISAIADSLRDAALAAEQMALALREGSAVGLKLAAEKVAKHSLRAQVCSQVVATRAAERLSRHARI